MSGTTIFQQQTIADAPLDWSRTLPFSQFDPSTGNLLDAVFTTAGSIDVSASIENLAPVAATVNLGVATIITASVPAISETVASFEPSVAATVNLGAFQGTFDGTLDFGGPSGTVLPDLTASQTQVAVVNLGTEGGSPLLGNNTFDVDVNTSSSSTVEGNGNLAVLLHGSAGAVLSLQYHATTPSAGYSDYGAGVFSGLMWGGDFGMSPWFTAGIDNFVTSTPQVVLLPSQTSGWTGAAPFVQFNPALGTLDEVLLTVGNTVAGTFSAESLESGPASVRMSENASMTVTTPGEATGLIANAGTWDNLSLGAYDGSADFAGASGQSDTQPAASGITNDATLTGGVDLAAFTGTGTIALPISTVGSSTVTGPANLLTEITQQTGGSVLVSYVYTPFANAPALALSLADVVEPLDLMGASSHAALSATVGMWALNPPKMMFIGAIQSWTRVDAQPNERFVIGSGAFATIGEFSLTAGDSLNLTGLLAGAPLAHDLSNLGAYVTVTRQTADSGGGVDTTLAIKGPGGAASIVLAGNASVSVPDLLNNNVLILPAH